MQSMTFSSDKAKDVVWFDCTIGVASLYSQIKDVLPLLCNITELKAKIRTIISARDFYNTTVSIQQVSHLLINCRT